MAEPEPRPDTYTSDASSSPIRLVRSSAMVVASNLPDVTSNKVAVQKPSAQYLAQVQADEALADQRRQQEEEEQRCREEG